MKSLTLIFENFPAGVVAQPERFAHVQRAIDLMALAVGRAERVPAIVSQSIDTPSIGRDEDVGVELAHRIGELPLLAELQGDRSFR